MTDARAKLKEATTRLNEFTDQLERMADWKDGLEARLWRAQLRFELVGLDADEQDRLADEVHSFTSVCFALADRFKDSGDEREREAA